MSGHSSGRVLSYSVAEKGDATLWAASLLGRQDKSPRCAGRSFGGVFWGFERLTHIVMSIRTSRPLGFFSLLTERRTSQEIGP